MALTGKKLAWAVALAVLLAAVAGALTSCGSGSSPASEDPDRATTGELRISVRFPERGAVDTAALPLETDEVYVRVTASDIAEPIQVRLRRASSATTTVSHTLRVPSGAWRHVYAHALDDEDHVLAAGATNVGVLPNRSTTANIQLKNDCWKKVGSLATQIAQDSYVRFLGTGNYVYILSPGLLQRVHVGGGNAYAQAAPPFASNYQQGCASGGKLYVAAPPVDQDGLLVGIYDPATDSWQAMKADDNPEHRFKLDTYVVGCHVREGTLHALTHGCNCGYCPTFHWRVEVASAEFTPPDGSIGDIYSHGSSVGYQSDIWLASGKRYNVVDQVVTHWPSRGDAGGVHAGSPDYPYFGVQGGRAVWRVRLSTGEARRCMDAPVPILGCGGAAQNIAFVTDGNDLWRYDRTKDTYEPLSGYADDIPVYSVSSQRYSVQVDQTTAEVPFGDPAEAGLR